MIHIFVGTKAQFIKMAPIMLELDRRRIEYNFIDAGQHAELTGEIVHQFGLRGPDVFLRAGRANINTMLQAISWTAESLSQVAFRRRSIFQSLFRGQPGICLIHGDTLTTLLSVFYAKGCGMKVAHVEAGLRSYDFLNPFPEEIIRLIAMRYSDLLFAPSDWAAENLHRMSYSTKIVCTGGNTIAESIRHALQKMTAESHSGRRYVVASIHRLENIYFQSRLTVIVTLLERIAADRQVLFVLHEPTNQQLRRFGLTTRLLRNKAIELLPLQPYPAFIQLMAGADFIVTDGGSVQEESYFLNLPCLIMRRKTERCEGLGINACLAEFNQTRIDGFLRTFASYRRANADADNEAHPSRVIVDHLMPWA